MVLNHIADKEGATIYPTIFWTAMTLARLVIAFLPCSSSQKLKSLILGSFFSGAISLILIYMNLLTLACYASAVLFGISLSSIYPLIFSFPLEQGFTLEDSQTTNIVTTGLISEGIMTALAGVLMHWLDLNMFFFSLCFMTLAMFVLEKYCVRLIDKNF